MSRNIDEMIKEAIGEIISKSEGKIDSLGEKHEHKIHFIPQRYRVFGGMLQSMNIQFGNFIEKLMELIIESDGKYAIERKYSGKKSNSFKLSKYNNDIVDEYIAQCQVNNYDDIVLSNKFVDLLKDIVKNRKIGTMYDHKHDIDILFKDKKKGTIYYLECKYNDDHDTGKFVDINRKFIKTYAYLVKEYDIDDFSKIVPILFFFTNNRKKGNIYVPEKSNIYRGERFFKNFLSLSYATVDQYLTNVSESPQTIQQFDDLYQKIVKQA